MKFQFGGINRLVAIAAIAMSFATLGSAQETVAVAEQPAINGADTAFMFVSACLVLLMTPGLALFYGGMVRRKNVLSTMMHSFAAMAVISIQWILFGYSLAFGPDIGGVIGNPLTWFGLGGMLANEPVSGTIPHYLFVLYQGMFAIITPALISGAVAERMKFKTYIVFIILWATLVYDPVCHWVWNSGGWLFQRGALDFAGGTVVHMTSGFTALILALMLGKRRGFPEEPILPHSLPLTLIGTGLLWFGWFGFNPGSALAANEQAIVAFMATNTAAAAAALTWMLLDWIFFKKPTALGTASGAVAGLVAITPAAGFVGPMSAIAIGITAGWFCRFIVRWRTRRGIDDSLDAFGVHGMGGMAGALLTGVFASYAGKTGLIQGNVAQFIEQVIGVVATAVYAVVMSFIILKVLDVTMGLRVNNQEEFQGLDLSQHGEAAYE